MQAIHLKPEAFPFLFQEFLKNIIIFVGLVILGILFEESTEKTIYFFGIIAFTSYRLFRAFIKYKKENYSLYKDKIIVKQGGLFRNYEAELNISKITYISNKIPYLTHKLFKTGNLTIFSAGSSHGVIKLNNILESSKYIEYIEKLMANNKFNLSKDEVVQSEEPDSLGIIIYTLFIYSKYSIVVFLLSCNAIFLNSLFLTTLLIFIGLLLSIGIYLFGYLELKRKSYILYKDVIVFEKYFFNKEYTLIPIQNLANISSKQNFIERIYDLSNIIISCQGLADEIQFLAMKHGNTFENNVNNTIQKLKLQKIKEKIIKKHINNNNGDINFILEKKLQKANENISIPFKVSLLKNIISTDIPTIFLMMLIYTIVSFYLDLSNLSQMAVFVIGIFSIVASLAKTAIDYISKTYTVKSYSIEESYRLFQKEQQEFYFDKITQVHLYTSLIDRIIGSYSIILKSIGTSNIIHLKNIRNSEVLAVILDKLKLNKSEILYRGKIRFNLYNIISKNIFSIVNSLFIIIATIIAFKFFKLNLESELGISLNTNYFMYIQIIGLIISFGIYAFKKIHFKNHHFTLHKKYFLLQKGILNKVNIYTMKKYFNSITSVEYPLSRNGSLIINVAGDINASYDTTDVNAPKKLRTKHNRLKIHYLKKVNELNEIIYIYLSAHKTHSTEDIEEILNSKTHHLPEAISEFKEHLPSKLLKLILSRLIIFPVLLIELPTKIIQDKFIKHFFYPDRIEKHYGILFKHRKILLSNKIDYLDYVQNYVGKTFNTAKLYINASGRKTPELKIDYVKNYNEKYNTIMNISQKKKKEPLFNIEKSN